MSIALRHITLAYGRRILLRDLSLILGGKPAEEGELHYYKRLE